MIVLTGATGTIGRLLVRLLAIRGEGVRALTREPERRGRFPGIEWVRADLADRRSLPPLLEGAESLFLLTGNGEDMVRLQKNAIEAARKAGTRRIVKLSALGASDHSKSVIGLWHYNVERALRDSGIPSTILRPHHFTQNLLDPAVFERDAGRVYSASGEGKIPFIDTRDISAVAAAVLTQDGHEGATYTLTGPEAVSYRDMTAILSEALGRSLTYIPQTDDEAWRRLRATGLDPWAVAARLAIAGYQRAGGPTEAITDSVERITGRAAHTVRDFAEDYAASLGETGHTAQ